MTNNRLLLHVALLASTLGCFKSKSPQQQHSPVFCAKQSHITQSAPWTQDWEGCVEGWQTLVGEAVTLATDTTSPAKSKVQSLNKVAMDSEDTIYSPWLTPIEVVKGSRA